MRWLWVLVAACGSEEGALLSIRAPEGPLDVSRLEIVLAAEHAVDVDDQRVAPRDFTVAEPVRYYRQRATAGAIDGVGRADGFTLRIEPNIAMVPETTFIPFLVAYGATDDVIGIGAVLDETGMPSRISVESGAARKYFVDLVALAPMDPARAMGERERIVVACDDVTSGIAWRPARAQLRLLLAERGTSDASERPLDLDCDGHTADASDCDDLRAAFHAGSKEACDGMDHDCDGAHTIVQSCANANCMGGGVQLCDDRSGEPLGACEQTAACACIAGGPCAYCALAFEPTSSPTKQKPCAPAAGKMQFPGCTDGAPCVIDVLATTPPWTAYVSNQPTTGFTTRITVTTGEAYIELKAGEVAGQANDSVGTLNLLVTQGTQRRLVSVDLQLAEGACATHPDSSLFVMACGP